MKNIHLWNLCHRCFMVFRNLQGDFILSETVRFFWDRVPWKTCQLFHYELHVAPHVLHFSDQFPLFLFQVKFQLQRDSIELQSVAVSSVRTLARIRNCVCEIKRRVFCALQLTGVRLLLSSSSDAILRNSGPNSTYKRPLLTR